MKIRKMVLTTLLVLVLIFASPFTVAAADADVIAGRLMCQCGGCSLPITECDHQGCSSAEPMHEQVRQMVAEGQSEDAIIGYFVNTYGGQVLYTPAPAPEQDIGQNAGVIPFVAIIFAGVIAFFVISKLAGRSRAKMAPVRA